jgi:hypothetical protein
MMSVLNQSILVEHVAVREAALCAVKEWTAPLTQAVWLCPQAELALPVSECDTPTRTHTFTLSLLSSSSMLSFLHLTLFNVERSRSVQAETLIRSPKATAFADTKKSKSKVREISEKPEGSTHNT